MKRPIVLAACLVAVALVLALPVASAQDMAKTAAKYVKVLVDNDRMRVLELNMPAGASTGVHSHGDNFVYFVTGGTAKSTRDGVTKTVTRKAGESVFEKGPMTHETVNAGTAPVKTIIVELK